MSISPRSVSSEPEFLEYFPWTSRDDKKLVQAYVMVHDTVDHTTLEFLNNLTEAFNITLNVNSDYEDIRSSTELDERWGEIKRDVNLFCRIYTTIDNECPGDSEEQVLLKAKDLFGTLNEGRLFDLEDTWNILKDLPFF